MVKTAKNSETSENSQKGAKRAIVDPKMANLPQKEKNSEFFWLKQRKEGAWWPRNCLKLPKTGLKWA